MTNKYTAFRFVSETHKECSSCGEIKVHSEFHKDKNNKRIGLSYYCKECANKKAREFHKAKERDLEYKLLKKDHHIKVTYGISYKEYVDKLVKQGSCAICKKELEGIGNHTHLDHCHKTGKNREFLCSNCNRGIGCFHDDIHKLLNAIAYLNKHKENK